MKNRDFDLQTNFKAKIIMIQIKQTNFLVNDFDWIQKLYSGHGLIQKFIGNLKI